MAKRRKIYSFGGLVMSQMWLIHHTNLLNSFLGYFLGVSNNENEQHERTNGSTSCLSRLESCKTHTRQAHKQSMTVYRVTPINRMSGVPGNADCLTIQCSLCHWCLYETFIHSSSGWTSTTSLPFWSVHNTNIPILIHTFAPMREIGERGYYVKVYHAIYQFLRWGYY